MTPRAVSNSAAPRALGRDKHRAAQAAAAARQKAGKMQTSGQSRAT